MGVFMQRRTFLQKSGAGLTASAISGFPALTDAHAAKTTDTPPLPRRPFSNTGEYLSIIGFPGLCMKNLDAGTAKKLVDDAIAGTVNYFDVAPAYANSEEVLGPALEPYREKVFLSCKTKQRTRDGMETELHDSLRKMRTDYFDLYQMHFLSSAQDIATAFGPNGAIEGMVQAQKEGKVRHLGITSHTIESAMAALQYYDGFKSVMFPVHYTSWYGGNFGDQLVKYARENDIAVLALKAMARERPPKGEKAPKSVGWYYPLAEESEAKLGLRFTLSQPVTTVLPPGDGDLFRLALKLAPSLLPMSESEYAMMEQKAKESTPMFTYPSDAYDIRKLHG
jgi:aryl-alcohol dehydrogenase-like predicted oxidoreductase